jgi:CBS domain-containing protein
MHAISNLIKGREILAVTSGQVVMEAVQYMVQHHIGAVPILRHGELVGIFSERDLMVRMVAEGRDATTTLVDAVMTSDPLAVSPDTSFEECMILMKAHGFRHLPICENRKLIGVISLRDLLLHDVEEKDVEVRMMRAYIQQAG